VNVIIPQDGSHPLANKHELDYASYTYPVEDDPAKIDVRLILSIIRRNIYIIISIIAICILLAIAVTLLTTPRYTAAASIQIDQEADRVLKSEDTDPNAGYQDADRFLQTQTDVIRSQALATRVAKSLNLFDDNRFFIAMKSPAPDAPEARRGRVVGALMTNMQVDLPRDSRVATLSFKSPDPAFAAKVANAYADNYIEYNLERKYDSSAYARDFLSKQLAAAKDRLETSERALNAYARQVGLIKTSDAAIDTSSAAASPAATQSITTSSLIQINQASNEAESDLVSAQEKWRTTQSQPLLNIPEVVSNQAVQNLLSERADKQASLEKELAIHQDQYPTVLNLRAQVAELDRQIQTIAQGIKQSVYSNYRIAADRAAQLRGQVAQLKGATLSEQDRMVRYNILAREADTNRTMYDGLLQRFKEVSAEAGITTNNVSIVDHAEAPGSPSSPKMLLNLALALMAGCVLAAGAVLVREQMDDAVRSPEDVERKLGWTPLGVIPTVPEGQRALDLLESPRSQISEAYHSLRTSLLYATVNGAPKTLLITSSQASEGKSTTSFAVAMDLAKVGKRVLLVDIDLRRPSLHGVMGMSNETGLSSVLTHQERIEAVIQRSTVDGLSFVPSGPIPVNPTELLASPLMREIIHRLSEKVDIVVFDGPPVLGLADAPLLSSMMEGTLFVVESNRGHRGATKGALKRLQAAKANILGIVLTKFDAKKSGVSNYYGYDYYYYGDGIDHKAPGKLDGPATPDAA
jgi:capsular exopolysaccharide synthesis family protein